VKLGIGGVEDIIQIRLTPEEQDALEKSAQSVLDLLAEMKG
jgi:malate/lactate dehydrogenase